LLIVVLLLTIVIVLGTIKWGEISVVSRLLEVIVLDLVWVETGISTTQSE